MLFTNYVLVFPQKLSWKFKFQFNSKYQNIKLKTYNVMDRNSLPKKPEKNKQFLHIINFHTIFWLWNCHFLGGYGDRNARMAIAVIVHFSILSVDYQEKAAVI